MQAAVLDSVDHLVYAARDLGAAADELQHRLGVRAALGGAHPGLGTHNALLALGPACYLEIIAPDPDQFGPKAPRWLGVDDIEEARLTTWAMKSNDFASLVNTAAAHDIPIGEVREGRRVRADGTPLSWQLTFTPKLVGGGLMPFFIDWRDAPHPAASAPQGVTLTNLRGEHPDPRPIRTMLSALGVELAVDEGERPALIATLRTPTGEVELR